MERSAKGWSLLRAGVVTAGVVLAAGAALAAGAPPRVDLPVQELDPHYRGRDGHGYTEAMLELGMRLGAAAANAPGKDRDQGRRCVAAFREQYEKVAAMVPSWRKRFPLKPVQELEAAVTAEAAPKAIRKLIDEVQNTCTDCHVSTMFPVQARYKWGDFAEAGVRDDDNHWVGFHDLMVEISYDLGAVRNLVRNRNVEQARKHYEDLRSHFTLMELTCANCHDQPREYFIDARVKGRLLRMGGLLRKGSLDQAEYTALMDQITASSCIPCHQVHMPAAYLQMFWHNGRGR